MNPIDWRRAQTVFEQVVDASPAERDRLIRELCRPDSELEQAVRELVEEDGRDGALVDRVPVTAVRRAVDDEMGRRWIGRSVGTYRVLEKIGQGGMGQVFLAEREDEAFSKRVAVKIMSVASASALERFHRERQILADLEHPGIARLLDGGTTPDGLPFVVMELVEGVTFTEHCDSEGLTLESRLRIFLKVCETVQFAHRNLVVHRDLKPSNILVTSDGQTKLLDFGIAKLLSPEGPSTEATLAPDRAMTLDYASPEQLSAAPVTTATDVYSLGVVLYRTLTGQLPARRTRADATAAVSEAAPHRPAPPSAMVARATPRGEGSPPLPSPRALQGDLDNVVLKALRREPAERYPSVEAFANDLRNYLAGLPVEARAPSFGYRAIKFVRRHPLAVSAALLFAAIVLGFSITTFVQGRELQAERDVSREALDFLVEAFERTDPAVNLGREPTAMEIIDRGAQRLAAAEGPPTEVQRVLMHTLGQIHNSLGAYEEAREWFERSLEAGEFLDGTESPGLAPVLQDLGEVLLTMAEFEAADNAARRALGLLPENRPTLRIEALHTLAEARAGLGEARESAALHSEAVAIARAELAESDPLLVYSLGSLGRALRYLGDLDGASGLADETLDLQQRYRPGDNPDTARLLAGSGVLRLARGDLQRAREDSTAALEMRRRIYGESHDSVARSLKTLGKIAARQGRLEDAEALMRQSLEVFRAVFGDDNPQTVGARYDYAGLLHEELGAPERAEPIYREAIASYERVEGSGRSSQLASLVGARAAAMHDLARYVEAEALWRRALDIRLSRGEGDQERGLACRLGLGTALAARGSYEPAIAELLIAWQALGEREAPNDDLRLEVGTELAKIYSLTGRSSEAARIAASLAGLDSNEGDYG